MKTIHTSFCRLLSVLLLGCIACNKASDLNQIPDSNLLVLTSVDDAQALLDNTNVMEETPSLGEVSADDFYVPSDSTLSTMNPVERNAYLWNSDIFQGQTLSGDWFAPYQQVYYANSILAKVPDLTGATDNNQLNHIKGACLFIRAYAFYNVALEFADLYSTATEMQWGIPLPLAPNPEARSERATIKDTYQRILTDLKEALPLLPDEPDPNRKNRPSVPAALALLARIYLSMGDNVNAKAYADSCLQRYKKLIDYNNFTGATVNPFGSNNDEVLYQSNLLSTTDVFYRDNCYVDTFLYASYSDQDLRKQLFFKNSTGGVVSQYSYSGNKTKFSGLAVDEIFLIRAECNARLGLINEALQDITTLLTKRWKNNAYNLPPVNSPAEVLDLVMQERRKELFFRGLRWIDVRRLNKINPAITLKRLANGKIDSLLPGSRLYILPIPPDVISFNTTMPQNQR